MNAMYEKKIFQINSTFERQNVLFNDYSNLIINHIIDFKSASPKKEEHIRVPYNKLLQQKSTK